MGVSRVWYPGRVGLLGEHCDWAGGTSLTVPTPMGVEVKAESARSDILVRSDLEGELVEDRFPIASGTPARGPLRFIPAIVDHLLELRLELKPAEIWVRSDLPTGRGLSSSAAFTLGVVDAWTRLSGHALAGRELAEAAYQIEHRHLGVACGRLDQMACAAARPLLLQWDKNGGVAHSVTLTPFRTFHLVVAVMAYPRNTPLILETLNRSFRNPIGDRDGDLVREAVAEFGAAAERGAYALQTGDAPALGEAMNAVQRIYDINLAGNFTALNAPKLRQTVSLLLAESCLGAKFSGAGGDGSVVALFSDESAARGAAIDLEQRGFAAWYIPLSSV